MASKKKNNKRDFTTQLDTDFKRVKSCDKSSKAVRKNIRQDLWKTVKETEDYDDDL